MTRRLARPLQAARGIALALLLAAATTPLPAGEGKPPKPVEVEKPKSKPATTTAAGKKPAQPKAEKPKPKPKPSFSGAREAIAKGDYAEGLRIIEAILPKSSPKAVRAARALRVKAHLETGKYKEAVAEAAQVVKLAPKDASALVLHAEGLIITGQYEEARKRLAEAIQADDTHVKARLLALELAHVTGDRPAKEKQVTYFFDLYNQGKAKGAEALTAVARAVQDEDPHGAWRTYQDAQQADGKYIEAYVEAGFLCLEKYAWQFARENFAKTLKLNPHYAVGHAGLAAVLLANSKFDKALPAIEAALKTNPNLPLALHLKASLFAAEQKHKESLAAIQAALEVDPRNPRTLSLLAAHYEAVVKPGDRDKAIAQVLKINPRYADVYTTLSLACQRLRRSPSAIAWGRKAVKLRPRYWHGYYLTGMNLIRAGEEKEGYELLERAFQLNPFNIWAANTLTVLDRDFKKKEFVYHQTAHFFVKLDKREDKILWPYIEMLLEPMYERLTKKYRFEPTGPMLTAGKTLVLLYPKHSEFSARTTGLPGLSALGACLGQVITMPSPAFARRRPAGAFNWKQVLIHEFAHVVTLQKTDYHIPRWFTEGISVWEEEDTRVKWDQILVYGIDQKKLLPLEDFNRGFTRPKFRQQVPLSYYQASLITRHFHATYGMDAILKMLDLFKEGKQTAQVLPEATGKTLKQLNDETLACIRDYAKPIRRAVRVGKKELKGLEEKAKKDDKNADLWAKIAIGRLQARKPKEARAAAAKAAQLNPKLARAHGILGFIAYSVDKDHDKAKEHYLAAKKADPDYFPARLYLGLLTRGDFTDEAIVELEAARRLAPRFIQKGRNPYKLLAQLYADDDKPQKAIAVLRDLCKLDSNDAAACAQLAELLADEGKHAEAAAVYLDSIYINPFDLRIHMAAAREYEAAKDPAQAAREYGVAVALEPSDMKALVGHARALAASGQPAACRKALAAIRALDPDNEEAAEIEKSLNK